MTWRRRRSIALRFAWNHPNNRSWWTSWYRFPLWNRVGDRSLSFRPHRNWMRSGRFVLEVSSVSRCNGCCCWARGPDSRSGNRFRHVPLKPDFCLCFSHRWWTRCCWHKRPLSWSWSRTSGFWAVCWTGRGCFRCSSRLHCRRSSSSYLYCRHRRTCWRYRWSRSWDSPSPSGPFAFRARISGNGWTGCLCRSVSNLGYPLSYSTGRRCRPRVAVASCWAGWYVRDNWCGGLSACWIYSWSGPSVKGSPHCATTWREPCHPRSSRSYYETGLPSNRPCNHIWLGRLWRRGWPAGWWNCCGSSCCRLCLRHCNLRFPLRECKSFSEIPVCFAGCCRLPGWSCCGRSVLPRTDKPGS